MVQGSRFMCRHMVYQSGDRQWHILLWSWLMVCVSIHGSGLQEHPIGSAILHKYQLWDVTLRKLLVFMENFMLILVIWLIFIPYMDSSTPASLLSEANKQLAISNRPSKCPACACDDFSYTIHFGSLHGLEHTHRLAIRGQQAISHHVHVMILVWT